MPRRPSPLPYLRTFTDPPAERSDSNHPDPSGVDAGGDDQSARAIRLIAKHGILRRSELVAAGVHHETLARLLTKGKLQHPALGLYQLPDRGHHEFFELALIAKRAPRSVICLESALKFHGLAEQRPPHTWVAIGRTDRVPRIQRPPVRCVRFGPRAFDHGIEIHLIEGVPVNIYCPAKTVVDCFRLQRLVGHRTAIEALRQSLAAGQAAPADIRRFADVAGIGSRIKPYLMALAPDDS